MMSAQNNNSPVPDWLLERYALGELPQERMDAVRRALAAEPDGAERLAALERSNASILEALPPRVVAAAVNARAENAASGATSRGWFTGLGMVAAAALALFVIRGPLLDGTPSDGVDIIDDGPGELEETRIKGPPMLLVHRLQGKETIQLDDEDAAKARDRLQISYVARDGRYGLIASLDGNGVVTLHSGDRSPIELDRNGKALLPHSYELDDAPAFERFFFIASDTPFDAAPVMDAIRDLDPKAANTLTDPLPLPDGLMQDSITLTKVP